MINKIIGLAVGAGFLFGGSTSALAALKFNGTGRGMESALPLSASVDFALADEHLVVTLKNTSSQTIGRATDVLTAVFFNFGGGATLTPVSALLAGSTVINRASGAEIPGATGGGNVGGEWGYGGAITAQYFATRVISSSGLGLGNFGAASAPNFGGSDLNDNASGALAGIDYGLIGSGNTTYTDGIKDALLIRNSVVFTFLISGGTFDPNQIGNVTFQYGTSLTEGHYQGTPVLTEDNHQGPPVPEPTTLIAGALLLLPFGASTLRLLRKNRPA